MKDPLEFTCVPPPSCGKPDCTWHDGNSAFVMCGPTVVAFVRPSQLAERIADLLNVHGALEVTP